MPYGDRKRKGRLHRDPKKWTAEEKARLVQRILAEEALERARDLESSGWEAWYSEMFDTPEAPFVERLAAHHREAIAWHWNMVMFKRAGLDVSRMKDAYFAIWSRGHMKSTIARYIAIADACLSGIGYCLYVSGTKAKVRGHAISIETLLGSAKVAEYYPGLSRVKRGQSGQSKGWQADFIYTEAGYVFHFISLDEGVAGANIDSVRPTLIIPDDVDDRDDSPLISENRLRVLTRAILPTRQKGTLVFWAQNYISRHSVLYAVDTGKQRFLTNRVKTRPIPAVIGLKTEIRTVDGIVCDIIVAGTPTWAWYDLERCQQEINTIGLDSFLAECQHEVELDKSGLVLQEYDEEVHVITWEEFNAVYGLDSLNRDLPAHWKRYIANDWGSSGAEGGHACVVPYIGVAGHNGPYPGTAFLYNFQSFRRSVLTGEVGRAILEYVLAASQSDPRTYIELGILDRATSDPGDALARATRSKVIDLLAGSNVALWHMSHEAKAVRDIYRMVYGIPFQACNPGKDGGVEQLRHYLRVDYNQDHPFRPGKRGLCRFFLIVEDDAQRRQPKGDPGMQLARQQLADWRWRPPTLTNKGFLDERPLKQDDDTGNGLMMIFTHFRLYATPLTATEQQQAAIHPSLRYDALLANSPFENGLTPEQELAHILALARARKARPAGIEYYDDYGQRMT